MSKGLILFATLAVLSACEGNSGDRFGHPPHASSIKPYTLNSPYAELLVPCVTVAQVGKSCQLADLPPIAMNTPEPAIEDIMERVVVSHPWMGMRFEQLLQELPHDLHTLFGAVTAVVIGAEIRPSYYSRVTGAIYLDPYNLWMTQDEKNVISREADYRAAFAEPMRFRSFWRTTRDGRRAFIDYGFDYGGTREISDVVIPMASLLFHELAHANDFMPPALYHQVNVTDSFFEATDALFTQYPSTQLASDVPLESDAMYRIADILYAGATPNDTEKQITAQEVGSHFEPDRATDDYAYRSQYEDFAMAFEEAMMKIHFDVDRDIAFVNAPSTPTSCNDYTIGWGVRHRVGEPRVKARAEQAIESLLPQRDYSAELADFPTPLELPAGKGWCETEQSVDTLANKPGGATPAMMPSGDALRPYDLVLMGQKE